jgi:hypothetical protein
MILSIKVSLTAGIIILRGIFAAVRDFLIKLNCMYKGLNMEDSTLKKT